MIYRNWICLKRYQFNFLLFLWQLLNSVPIIGTAALVSIGIPIRWTLLISSMCYMVAFIIIIEMHKCILYLIPLHKIFEYNMNWLRELGPCVCLHQACLVFIHFKRIFSSESVRVKIALEHFCLNINVHFRTVAASFRRKIWIKKFAHILVWSDMILNSSPFYSNRTKIPQTVSLHWFNLIVYFWTWKFWIGLLYFYHKFLITTLCTKIRSSIDDKNEKTKYQMWMKHEQQIQWIHHENSVVRFEAKCR